LISIDLLGEFEKTGSEAKASVAPWRV